MRYVNNLANVTGEIIQEPILDHVLCEERYFRMYIAIERLSGVADVIPVIFSERAVDVAQLTEGKVVKITGEYRSHNTNGHCDVYIYTDMFSYPDFNKNENRIELDGHICKKSETRETPLGRWICDFILAVNRPYGKSDYLPCIAWGRDARYVSTLDIGTHININGRLQSRKYVKHLENGEKVERTAYEMSIRNLAVIDDLESSADFYEMAREDKEVSGNGESD
jgi:primosomal replication protein N